ncbi:hypothetical protein KQ51_01730 [Candidatus Izimaplasma bacterium HR1]|uniref:hypothetical protein n=1 Tax=Candidatus Izimoplasma sp. HR1 TaxID=1541959 RepID=UPI0004F8EEFA|nr:hypothetical protein KQ51_01730 [Candidatus Izimaplasma bacterium HR1]
MKRIIMLVIIFISGFTLISCDEFGNTDSTNTGENPDNGVIGDDAPRDYESLNDVEKAIYNMERIENVTMMFRTDRGETGVTEYAIKISDDFKYIDKLDKYQIKNDKYYDLYEEDGLYYAIEKFESDELSWIDIDINFLISCIEVTATINDGYIEVYLDFEYPATVKLYIEDHYFTMVEYITDSANSTVTFVDIDQTILSPVEYTLLTGLECAEFYLKSEGYVRTLEAGTPYYRLGNTLIHYDETGGFVEVSGGLQDLLYYPESKEVHIGRSSIYTIDEYFAANWFIVTDPILFEVFDLLDD